MKVSDRDLEEQTAEEAQDRVAEIPVQEGHRAALNAPEEPVAHHQVVAGAKPVDVWLQAREVVASIRVAHDYVRAACGADAVHQRGSVSLGGDLYDSRVVVLGNANRLVGASVVGDQNFAIDVGPGKEAARLIDTIGERLLLVETRHEDRQLNAHLCLLKHSSVLPSVAASRGVGLVRCALSRV